jgi:hypothetical protein
MRLRSRGENDVRFRGRASSSFVKRVRSNLMKTGQLGTEVDSDSEEDSELVIVAFVLYSGYFQRQSSPPPLSLLVVEQFILQNGVGYKLSRIVDVALNSSDTLENFHGRRIVTFPS